MSSHRTHAYTQTPSIITLDWQAAQQQQHLVPIPPSYHRTHHTPLAAFALPRYNPAATPVSPRQSPACGGHCPSPNVVCTTCVLALARCLLSVALLDYRRQPPMHSAPSCHATRARVCRRPTEELSLALPDSAYNLFWHCALFLLRCCSITCTQLLLLRRTSCDTVIHSAHLHSLPTLPCLSTQASSCLSPPASFLRSASSPRLRPHPRASARGARKPAGPALSRTAAFFSFRTETTNVRPAHSARVCTSPSILLFITLTVCCPSPARCIHSAYLLTAWCVISTRA
jgi:hypothetical protein